MNEIERAQTMVDRYFDAEIAVLEGRTVSFNGRTLTYESLAEIRKGRAQWEERLFKLKQSKNSKRPQYKLARF